MYRRFFHPLSKYPGPFLNSVSDIPAGLSLLRGRFAFENKLYHEKYGTRSTSSSPKAHTLED